MTGSGPADVTRRSLLIGAGGAAVSAPAIVPAQRLGSAPQVTVVGAGVFGSWTAEQLRRRGARVTLVDAYGPAHSRASSGGESRMTRAAYGKDDIYTRMALASLAEWKTLSAAAGLPIFVPHGVLMLFPREEQYFLDTMAAHRRLGLPTQALGPAELARRFPMIDMTGIAVGTYEPGFGALMARRAVQTLVGRFLASGGSFEQRKFQGTSSLAPSDHLVLALGPWLPRVLPGLLRGRIVATRQEVFTFAPPSADARFTPAQMPGWADFNGGDLFYGFPDLEGKGVKFARDTHGVEVDPDRNDRRFTDAALAAVIAFRDRRFPLLRGAPLATSEVCQYENSSNGDFLIAPHPQDAKVTLVGGGSGHGFKHGPEVGRLAAELVLDGKQPDPRFGLATKSNVQKREVI
ncbi:FAD-dependent oxidoreductase [Sphingomonas humi]|uniref:N-methyl-L-tryptophan oxidase n=1 Tax=Sphingomonas humi TaxID=335630 RepID=A0ABP7S282_9SPHN